MSGRIAVVLFGAAGRMGREVAAVVRDDPAFEFARAIDGPDHPDLGKPLADARGRVGPPVLEHGAAALPPGAVVVDFSAPPALRGLLDALLADPRPLVSGTTGVGAEERSRLGALARVAPVIHAPNMSVGIAALRAAAALLARALGEGFDVELVEIHHSGKKDAPSGTALAIAGDLAATGHAAGAVVRAPTAPDAVSLRTDPGPVRLTTDARRPREIGIAALRGGAVVGDHTVHFLGPDERLELTHRATSRALFARGAARAAAWIARRPPGLYTMADVLGLADPSSR